jgi:ubiquinone biosynthesis protein
VVTDTEGRPGDLAWGAFSDTPPWILDRDAIAWRAAVPSLRATVAAELPGLTAPGGLPPGARFVRVTGRLLRALGPWFVRNRLHRYPDATARRADLSKRLRRAAEDLGPTYIKLGQIISSGEGLFPEELVSQFKLLRDQVVAETFATVREVVEADLGATIEATFEWFDRRPLAAASIAQVHAARLRTGETVVVKVQRPQVQQLVRADLRAMAWLAPHLVGRIPVAALANPPALVELFAETISEELDFRLEADNMLAIASVLADLGQRGYVVPRPHPSLVTRRVLVMERLDGFAFDDVASMRAAGIDTEAVVRTGMIAFLEGAMVHGIFHGDLHGGNLFVLPDGRTALLDFGIVGRLSGARRLAFLRLMLGATTNDVASQLAALRDLGALPADTDIPAVIRDLRLDQPPVDPTTLSADQMVREVQRVVKALLGYGARMPKELMLFVKNLVFLDGAIATLAPDLDLIGEVAAISVYFANTHGERLGRELGIDHRQVEIDLDGFKAGLGVEATTERLTYRQLQERRALINRRMRERSG